MTPFWITRKMPKHILLYIFSVCIVGTLSLITRLGSKGRDRVDIGVFEDKLDWFSARAMCEMSGYHDLDDAPLESYSHIGVAQLLQEDWPDKDIFTLWTYYHRPQADSNTWYKLNCMEELFKVPHGTNEQCIALRISTDYKSFSFTAETCTNKYSFMCLKKFGQSVWYSVNDKQIKMTDLPSTITMATSTRPSEARCKDGCMVDCVLYEYSTSSSECTHFKLPPDKAYINVPLKPQTDMSLRTTRVVGVNVTFHPLAAHPLPSAAPVFPCQLGPTASSSAKAAYITSTSLITTTTIENTSTTSTTATYTISTSTRPKTTTTTASTTTTHTTTTPTTTLATTTTPTTTKTPTTTPSTTTIPITTILTTTTMPTTTMTTTPATMTPKTTTTTTPETTTTTTTLTIKTTTTPMAATTPTTTTASTTAPTTATAQPQALTPLTTSVSAPPRVCHCRFDSDFRYRVSTSDPALLQKAIDSLVSELTVNKTITSAYRRRRVSVMDNRISSTYIGAGAVVFMALFGLAIVLPDVASFCIPVRRSISLSLRNRFR